MLDIDNCLRYKPILYTRRFGSWLYSRLQMSGSHNTQIFYYVFTFNISSNGRDCNLDLLSTTPY
jgi:hypothetical protein